tara:strand:- start:779 stop:1519 length:741 start_codon:yes stop_codon:yes gene_type:complete
MKNINLNFCITLIIPIIIAGCSIDENNYTTNANINFNAFYQNSNNHIILDSMVYVNAEGENYSIKNLKYLITNLSILTADGATLLLKDIHFIDFLDESSLSIDLGEIPNNIYTHLNFQFGLDSSINISNKFVNENFHATMAWPEIMGGGYHYMKLEGSYNNDSTFYNTHTGPSMGEDFSFNKSMEIPLNVDGDLGDISIYLNMHINNWYQNPYSLNFEGAIMMDMPKQMQLKMNGITDVFSIELIK